MSPALPSAEGIRPDLRPESPLDARLVELYRTATPERKLAAVDRLNRTLQALKEAELTANRPDMSVEERRSALRRWWLSDRP